MVVKVKEKFEKTRHVKNNDKSKKYILRRGKNVRYHDRILSNKNESYNFIIYYIFLYIIIYNFIISRLSSEQKKHMTSVAKDHTLIRHQPLNILSPKITILQIIGCNCF